MGSLCLVPIYFGDRQGSLAPLQDRLRDIFDLTVEIHPPWFDPEIPFDPSRGQYNSNLFLACLLKGERAANRLLGVTAVDLFIPVLTFVFGEAQLGGRAAVVSIHRLRNEAYGLPVDDVLLLRRLEKEAVHEIGHTFGLIHCHNAGCVMQSSTYVEEIDLKEVEPCASCRRRLDETAR